MNHSITLNTTRKQIVNAIYHKLEEQGEDHVSAPLLTLVAFLVRELFPFKLHLFLNRFNGRWSSFSKENTLCSIITQ